MKYVKPDLYVEEFELNTNIAACNRLPTGNYEYKATEIDCVVTTSDVIFTATTNGCDHDVDPNNSGSGYMWVTYNDTLYFCWTSNLSSGGGGDMDLLKDILAAGGVSDVMVGDGYVWHAGPATDYMKQLWSHSY